MKKKIWSAILAAILDFSYFEYFNNILRYIFGFLDPQNMGKSQFGQFIYFELSGCFPSKFDQIVCCHISMPKSQSTAICTMLKKNCAFGMGGHLLPTTVIIAQS